MENWIWGGLGAVLGTVFWVVALRWVPALLRPTGEVADPDLVEMVLSLQRSVKLIQGRLNALAPPREGTGRIAVAASQPETRAELLARIRGGGSA